MHDRMKRSLKRVVLAATVLALVPAAASAQDPVATPVGEFWPYACDQTPDEHGLTYNYIYEHTGPGGWHPAYFTRAPNSTPCKVLFVTGTPVYVAASDVELKWWLNKAAPPPQSLLPECSGGAHRTTRYINDPNFNRQLIASTQNGEDWHFTVDRWLLQYRCPSTSTYTTHGYAEVQRYASDAPFFPVGGVRGWHKLGASVTLYTPPTGGDG